MAGTLTAATIDSGAASTPPTFSANGTQIGKLCRAWVNFNGGNGNTAGVINGSFNVSSITVVSTGRFTVTFTTAMPSQQYTTIVNGNTVSGSYWNIGLVDYSSGFQGTGATNIWYLSNGAVSSPTQAAVAVFA